MSWCQSSAGKPYGQENFVVYGTKGFGNGKSHSVTLDADKVPSDVDLTAIASNTADIVSDAVKTTAGAVAEGIRATKFCKHCGEKIDADARFCTSCGKNQ